MLAFSNHTGVIRRVKQQRLASVIEGLLADGLIIQIQVLSAQGSADRQRQTVVLVHQHAVGPTAVGAAKQAVMGVVPVLASAGGPHKRLQTVLAVIAQCTTVLVKHHVAVAVVLEGRMGAAACRGVNNAAQLARVIVGINVLRTLTGRSIGELAGDHAEAFVVVVAEGLLRDRPALAIAGQFDTCTVVVE